MAISLTPHQTAALDYKNSISLSANAGSGKTFVLSRRFLQIAINTDVPLKKIAAITFTEKAAGELYRKIAGEVDKLLTLEPDDNLKRKLNSIRRQLVSANISTIHSFCVNILKEFPVEAELDANFIPIDSRESDELLDLSIQEVFTLSEENEELNKIIKELVRLFFSESRLRNQIKYLFNKRKNLENLKNILYKKDAEEISKFYDEAFLFGLGKILEFDKVDFVSNLQQINDAVLDEKSKNQIALEVSALLKILKNETEVFKQLDIISKLKDLVCTSKITIRIKGYLAKVEDDLSLELISDCENFFIDYSSFFGIANDKKLTRQLVKYGKHIIKLYDFVYENYSYRKKSQGLLDFEDILIKTKNLLELDPVKELLSEKFSYLMIDEYQDTNDIQYEIFLPLLDDLKKGNLFIVGDEKQSIYMFRDADISVFKKTSTDIRKKSGKRYILNLPDSFRMSPVICLFVNKLFENLFANPKDIFNEVYHSDLICARSDGFQGRIEILKKLNSETEFSEADLIARRILLLKQEEKEGTSINWNDIAILVRKRNSFTELEKSFTKYRIPYSIIGGKGFYQRQSIYDIYNFFSFLLDSGNDTALIGILRSPFFNISDPKIFSLNINGFNNLWEKLKLYSEGDSELKKVEEKLNKILGLAASISIPELLRMILQEFEFFSVLSSSSNGKQEIANIEKLIKLTSEFYNSGFKTLYDYVDFLKSSIEGIEDEAQAGLAESEESVNLMTIHQAKGLEFPVVFLFRCNETSQENNVKSRSVIVDKDFGILTKVPENGNYFSEYKSPPINLLYNFIESKKNTAEIKRLFYVAATRAKDYLFISSELKEDKMQQKNSFIYLLKKGLGIDLDKNEFSLQGDVKFLESKKGEYLTTKKNISSKTRILNYSDIPEPDYELSDRRPEEKLIAVKDISDHSKNEIISATKYSVFCQCPLKYKLIYQNGFNKIMEEQQNWNQQKQRKTRFEFNDSEKISLSNEEQFPSDSLSASVKGRIIHKVLQQNPDPENLSDIIKENISAYDNSINKEDMSNLTESNIEEEIISYINSDEYKFLNSFEKFHNEYEIYLKENNYYLFGIIDKLVYTNDKIIIVDYKTDNIADSEIEIRANTYQHQLGFYSYIIKGYLKEVKEIEGRIEFIKHPGKPVKYKYNEHNWMKLNTGIKNFINNLRENNFNPNFEHCSNCGFFLNSKKCVAIH